MEDACGVSDRDLGVAILAGGSRDHAPAEVMRHELQAITDAKDRQTCGEDGGVGLRCCIVIHAGGAAREDDAFRRQRHDLLERRGARQDHGEDIELANAACDQLRVLRAEIEDDDGRRDRQRRSGCTRGLHHSSLNRRRG